MSGEPFLKLRDLRKSFGETPVLGGVSLDIAEGEILALLGPSGSGKTTLLRLLAGFEKADGGAIVLAGNDVTRQTPARRRFGMVFQHYALFPHMRVDENIAFGLQSQGWDKARIAPRIEEMLRLVDLAGYGGRRVSEISGGQQQRVALARALATEPPVLLLDEPLSNLDPSLRESTRRQLREAVRRVGITTVLVTHEQEEAFHVGDRVAVLHGGRLAQVGTPEELYAAPTNRFVATFVGRASILPGKLEALDGDAARVRVGNALWTGTGVWATADAPAVGAAVELAARPEMLDLVEPGSSDSLSGEIVERRFTGAMTFASVRLDDGTMLEAAGSAHRARVGDRVGVAAREVEIGGRPRVFRG